MLAWESTKFRVHSSTSREMVLDFGNLALAEIFLEIGADVPSAPLTFTKCLDCGLIQLAHFHNSSCLYSETYDYESHLNKGMVSRLIHRAKFLVSKFQQNIPEPIIGEWRIFALSATTSRSGCLD
jgi:hypothetical protein